MSRRFHYYTGEVVRKGDKVRSAGRPGYVTEVLGPGPDAAACGLPEGGVLIVVTWDDAQGNEAWTPPDGEMWEDLEFLGREGAKA